jgi:hypothetical protein
MVELSEYPLLKQVRTFEFVFILLYTSIHILRANFYIGTTNQLLEVELLFLLYDVSHCIIARIMGMVVVSTSIRKYLVLCCHSVLYSCQPSITSWINRA